MAPPARRVAVWAGAAAVGVPAGILAHELGHYAAAALFGFPGLRFHYGSVTSSPETAGAQWQHGIEAAAGPLVTTGIVLLLCYAVRRSGPRPWLVAPAFSASARTVLLALAYSLARLRFRADQMSPNFDEYNAARAFGAPPLAIVALSALVILTGWGFLVRRLPRGGRAIPLMSVALGTVVGTILYMTVVGPALLP